MLTDKRVCFLGAGAMAEAIIRGLLQKGVISGEKISVIDPRVDRLNWLIDAYGLRQEEDGHSPLSEADIVVLAFKPKDIGPALRDYAVQVSANQLIISLLAGIKTGQIQDLLPEGVPVVRAMPNTSAAVGLSATALCGGISVKAQHIDWAKELFGAIGQVSVVAEERMDAVTALSGSGPAYIYFLAESMEEAGMAAGLDRETARRLTQQTLLGAAQMLSESTQNPAELRAQVTSPGGTTMAGIEALKEHHFKEAVQAAILSAAARSRDLSQLNKTASN